MQALPTTSLAPNWHLAPPAPHFAAAAQARHRARQLPAAAMSSQRRKTPSCASVGRSFAVIGLDSDARTGAPCTTRTGKRNGASPRADLLPRQLRCRKEFGVIRRAVYAARFFVAKRPMHTLHIRIELKDQSACQPVRGSALECESSCHLFVCFRCTHRGVVMDRVFPSAFAGCRQYSMSTAHVFLGFQAFLKTKLNLFCKTAYYCTKP